jgi:UDP-2,4-diacetamido-2,4,6-trideoxy-beta-L-altropyranose hydrolase
MFRKSIIFRVDASVRIGSGHVMRSLAIADAFKAQGWRAFFICRELPGNLFHTVMDRGHRLLALSSPETYPDESIDINDYSANLGVSWEEDARETLDIIRNSKLKPEWLIIDHYSLDRRWEEMVGIMAKKTFVIDDVAKKEHECDMLLNENFLPDAAFTYKKLVPEKTKLLLGPKYAIIRPEFREISRRRKPGDVKSRRILIFYGGADPTNETQKALQAISELQHPDLHLDVVVGSGNPDKEKIKLMLKQLPDAILHVQLPHLANLIAQTDLALCAGGSIVWELLSLDIPMLVTTTADNQSPSIRNLSLNGSVRWLGTSDKVGVEKIKNGIQQIISTTRSMRKKPDSEGKIIDGFGLDRVVKELEL